jgi:hypothetical protein
VPAYHLPSGVVVAAALYREGPWSVMDRFRQIGFTDETGPSQEFSNRWYLTVGYASSPVDHLAFTKSI